MLNELKNKIPSFINLAATAALDAKMNEVKNKITNITYLATSSALNASEKKTPNLRDLFEKSDNDTEIKAIKNKSFTTTDYNGFTNNILEVKITRKELVNESGLNEKAKTSTTKEEIMT